MKRGHIAALVVLSVLMLSGCTATPEDIARTSPVVQPPDSQEPSGCDPLRIEIYTMIRQANYCSQDSDCMTSTASTGIRCFFQWTFINRNADLSAVRVKEALFSGMGCMCPTAGEGVARDPPSQADIVCSSGKCKER